MKLPQDLGSDWEALLDAWRSKHAVRRLWERDATVWTGDDEGQWLGWLDIVGQMQSQLPTLERFGEEVRDAGFETVMLLGMGGSSLCADTLSKVFGVPQLRIVDSTDPSQVASAAESVDLSRTLFFVSSKSGTTLEPDIMRRYFFERAGEAAGARAGDQFVAVTDPGSDLEEVAARDGYRRIFYGVPEIGGRYSALSMFGMAPAAAAGLDVHKLLAGAQEMALECRKEDPAQNPGVSLGLALGVLARQGRDKLTIIASPGLAAVGAWLEQLIAESTGKQGKAIIPVDLEDLGAPEVYGDDRVFVALQLASDDPVDLSAIEAAGHPVIKIDCEDAYQLGGEFFRWEIATAAAGSALGINPFNQPDVQASKEVTKRLTSRYEETGRAEPEYPFFEQDKVQLYTDDFNAALLISRAGGADSLEAILRAHLQSLQPGRYFGLLAYLDMTDDNMAALQTIRHAVRDGRRAATCLGFGPRFLHSTGQAYKGGPNTGVFLQLTCEDSREVSVPGKKYTFGVVKAAQARGDFEVLSQRRRRALRAHLTGDVSKGLDRLRQAMEEATKA